MEPEIQFRHKPGQICTVRKCNRKAVAKGFCKTHYDRMRTGRQIDLPINSQKARRSGTTLDP